MISSSFFRHRNSSCVKSSSTKPRTRTDIENTNVNKSTYSLLRPLHAAVNSESSYCKVVNKIILTKSSIMTLFDSPYAISYQLSIVTTPLFRTVTEI